MDKLITVHSLDIKIAHLSRLRMRVPSNILDYHRCEVDAE